MCHSQTKAEKIFEEIKECFPYNKWASSIDVLILEGDYWDKLMPNNHPDVFITKESIYYLLKWCKYHDITFLIVDGTPLHDANQLQWFIHINKESGINADVRYFDDIAIDYISKYDINVLYIPDRPRNTPEDTYKTVLKLLEENNLEKVDIAIMHGCFQYQIPQIANDHKHKEEDYLNIVKGPIFIGHVHVHSTYDRIIATGSFSRISHGEESPKGIIETILNEDGSFKAKFIENKNATIYKTINLTDKETEECLDIIKNIARSVPFGSRLRLLLKPNQPIASTENVSNLKIGYPEIVWSIKIENDTEEVAKVEDIFNTEEEYTPMIINKNNIKSLVLERANSKEYNDTDINNIIVKLEEVI